MGRPSHHRETSTLCVLSARVRSNLGGCVRSSKQDSHCPVFQFAAVLYVKPQADACCIFHVFSLCPRYAYHRIYDLQMHGINVPNFGRVATSRCGIRCTRGVVQWIRCAIPGYAAMVEMVRIYQSGLLHI